MIEIEIDCSKIQFFQKKVKFNNQISSMYDHRNQQSKPIEIYDFEPSQLDTIYDGYPYVTDLSNIEALKKFIKAKIYMNPQISIKEIKI
jgi:hypothetical protein